jgi:hypothetical protein
MEMFKMEALDSRGSSDSFKLLAAEVSKKKELSPASSFL